MRSFAAVILMLACPPAWPADWCRTFYKLATSDLHIVFQDQGNSRCGSICVTDAIQLALTHLGREPVANPEGLVEEAQAHMAAHLRNRGVRNGNFRGIPLSELKRVAQKLFRSKEIEASLLTIELGPNSRKRLFDPKKDELAILLGQEAEATFAHYFLALDMEVVGEKRYLTLFNPLKKEPFRVRLYDDESGSYFFAESSKGDGAYKYKAHSLLKIKLASNVHQ